MTYKEERDALRQQLNKITEELHAHQIGHDHIIASKDAEIEHLDRTKAEWKNTAKLLDEQLVASQAREMRLREALKGVPIGYHGRIAGKDCVCGHCESNRRIEKARSLPYDTTALEAMIAEAGEVMRERCERESWLMAPVLQSIPEVTLEDLRK
jgi:hypothetical protein